MVFPCTVLPSPDLRLAQQSRYGAKQGNLFFSGSPPKRFSRLILVLGGISKILILEFSFTSPNLATILYFCSQPIVENLV